MSRYSCVYTRKRGGGGEGRKEGMMLIVAKAFTKLNLSLRGLDKTKVPL